jgi:hypothetical protein
MLHDRPQHQLCGEYPLRLISLTAALLCSTTALASATPIGIFAGEESESWEADDGLGAFPVCRPFGSASETCSDAGSIHTTGGWGFVCSMSPSDGSMLMGNTGAAQTLTFDAPISSFGGNFGTNSGDGETAIFDFYDDAGVLVDSAELAMPTCGTYTWAGWAFSSGVKTIDIHGLDYVMTDEWTWNYDAGSSVDLSLGGDCPGAAAIDISTTPRGSVMIVTADSLGTTVIPGGPCAGAELGIEASSGAPNRFGPIPDSDGDGLISLAPTLPAPVCSLFFQVLDLATCEVSGVQSF